MAADRFRELIQGELRKYLADSSSPESERTIAERMGALPVYADMGGVLLLGQDGEVLEVEWDNGVAAVVRDTCLRKLALFRAAARYPALAPLTPERPLDSPDCDACSGTGRVLSAICGVCMGAGW